MNDAGAPGPKGAGDGAPDYAPGGAANASNPVLSPGADLPPGFAVGEYRIQGVAGRGGMGVVYAAMQPVIEKKVAIKVLAAHFSSTPELVRRFVDEARAVNRIGHENIIDIFSFGQLVDGRQYFVMEYLDGATLAQRLDRGDLTRDQFAPILMQICDALEAAHAKQIVHRDLKPENVWIAQSLRGLPKVRLLDFGIAKLLDSGDRVVTDIGAVMGTPHYMSPEQCHGRGVDHRTDIYAMGVLLYRIYTGRLPFRGETFAEILAKQVTETPPEPSTIATVSAELDRLIMRCLDKDPAGRPQSVAELGSALADAVSGGVQAVPEHLSAKSMALPATELALPTPPSASAGSTAPLSIPSVTTVARRKSPVVVGVILVGLAAIGIAWFALRSSGTVDGSATATTPAGATPAATPPAATPSPAVPTVVPPTAPAAPSATASATAAETRPPPPAPVPRQGPDPSPRPTERNTINKRRVAPETEAAPVERPPGPKPSRASSSGLETRNPFE